MLEPLHKSQTRRAAEIYKNLITSRHNPLIKELKALKKALPDPSNRVILEGFRLIEEGLKSNLSFDFLFLVPGLFDSLKESSFFNEISRKVKIFQVTPQVMESLSLEETPPGILAVARVPLKTVQLSGDFFLALCGIQDPGNAGSILRSAEGAGFSVWFSEETVHPFHPKVVKSSMGSVFRVECEKGELIPFLKRLKEKGVSLIGTDVSKGVIYKNWDWKPPFCLLLGSEAKGLPDSINPLLDGIVHIPLKGKVESLNVAAAGGILLFESRWKSQCDQDHRQIPL